jgi:hypothetical protein
MSAMVYDSIKTKPGKINMTIDELKKIAEKKMGMSWEEIMKQADIDTENQKKLKDPISESYKKSSISPNSMFKKSMRQLNGK